MDEVATPDPAEVAALQVREWILSGELPADKRLPSERALAERLGVGRAAVRAAMAVLEAEHLVETRPRRVRVVRSQAGKARAQLMAETVALLGHPPIQNQIDTMLQPGWAHQIHRGAMAELMARGLGILMLGDDSLVGDRLAQLAASPPCGIAVIGEAAGLSSRGAILEAFHLSDTPIVAYGDIHEWPNSDVVVSDHAGGCHALTQWLIEQGCRRILRVWISPEGEGRAQPGWRAERDRGHRQALLEADLAEVAALRLDMLNAPYDAAGFERKARYAAGCLAERLLGDEPVDAVLAPSDGEAMLLARACEILGKAPGRGVRVAGYDNYWRDLPECEWTDCSPSVTVDKHNARIGRELVRLLLERIESDVPSPPQQRCIGQTVIPT